MSEEILGYSSELPRCRHSFATNLTHAGVPHNYISESMGLSLSPEQLEALIAMVKNPKILGKPGKMPEKISGESGV